MLLHIAKSNEMTMVRNFKKYWYPKSSNSYRRANGAEADEAPSHKHRNALQCLPMSNNESEKQETASSTSKCPFHGTSRASRAVGRYGEISHWR